MPGVKLLLLRHPQTKRETREGEKDRNLCQGRLWAGEDRKVVVEPKMGRELKGRLFSSGASG